MTVSIISLTEKGRVLSENICGCLSDKHEIRRFCFYKNCDEKGVAFSDINSLTAEIFCSSQALIFVCACGIAVRSIAPFVKSKSADPAVLVIDDTGRFVIPILSGHLGGANRLSEIISEKIGAAAIITTATDINGKFSPDSFAKANNLLIDSLSAAKEIAAAVLNGEKTGLCSDYECENMPPEITTFEQCRTGICISGDRAKKPFDITLNLVPKNIIIGIGCKRGTPCEIMERRISESLNAVGIDINRLCGVTTIDIKADEEGLLKFCEKRGLRLYTYTADELMSAEGSFSKSDFVLTRTGTDNVCERSIVKHGGVLIMPKTAGNGVTAAAGEMPVRIDFKKELL